MLPPKTSFLHEIHGVCDEFPLLTFISGRQPTSQNVRFQMTTFVTSGAILSRKSGLFLWYAALIAMGHKSSKQARPRRRKKSLRPALTRSESLFDIRLPATRLLISASVGYGCTA